MYKIIFLNNIYVFSTDKYDLNNLKIILYFFRNF